MQYYTFEENGPCQDRAVVETVVSRYDYNFDGRPPVAYRRSMPATVGSDTRAVDPNHAVPANVDESLRAIMNSQVEF